MKYKCFFNIIISCVLIISPVQAFEKKGHVLQKEVFTSNEQCISCHEKSQHDWQQSDHAKSMEIADKNSVLADFSDVSVEHYGQKAYNSFYSLLYSNYNSC